MHTRISTTKSLLTTEDRQRDITEARDHDRKEKPTEKYKDNTVYAKPHQTKVGDDLCVSQTKTI